MAILACDEAVTYIAHSGAENADGYAMTLIDGASWYAKRIYSPGDGAAVSTETIVRVPEENVPQGLRFSTGDYIARGDRTGSAFDPKLLQDPECFQITSIGDNRRGALPHWRISGS